MGSLTLTGSRPGPCEPLQLPPRALPHIPRTLSAPACFYILSFCPASFLFSCFPLPRSLLAWVPAEWPFICLKKRPWNERLGSMHGWLCMREVYERSGGYLAAIFPPRAVRSPGGLRQLPVLPWCKEQEWRKEGEFCSLQSQRHTQTFLPSPSALRHTCGGGDAVRYFVGWGVNRAELERVISCCCFYFLLWLWRFLAVIDHVLLGRLLVSGL